jgi:hypothetical protein
MEGSILNYFIYIVQNASISCDPKGLACHCPRQITRGARARERGWDALMCLAAADSLHPRLIILRRYSRYSALDSAGETAPLADHKFDFVEVFAFKIHYKYWYIKYYLYHSIL